MSDKEDDNGYKVGYKKPPLHSRFMKGVSGNRRGRPKNSNDSFAALLKREFAVKIPIVEGGRQKLITKKEALVKQLTSRALKGEKHAMDLLLKYDKEQIPENLEGLKSEDQRLLLSLLQEQANAG